MQFTIDRHTPPFIWTDVIRAFLEKAIGNNFGESIELRFVEATVLRLIRRTSDDYYILEGDRPLEHRLINVPIEKRYIVGNHYGEVEAGLRIFLEGAKCKMLIIKFDESDIHLHLINEDDELIAWAETYDEELHHRETVPSIKVATPPNA